MSSDYVVLQDGFIKLKQSVHTPEKAWSHDFNLPPDALVGHEVQQDERAVFLCQLNPSSDVDLTLHVSINGTLIIDTHLTSGVNRSRVEPFSSRLLTWQDNTVLFEIWSGNKGTIEFGKVVLWFHTT
jgi:hypothetical protein